MSAKMVVTGGSIGVNLDNTSRSVMVDGELVGDPGPTLEVFVSGMATNCTPLGSPIYLECFEGKWVLHVWADINQEDATHRIEMDGAFEIKRERQ